MFSHPFSSSYVPCPSFLLYLTAIFLSGLLFCPEKGDIAFFWSIGTFLLEYVESQVE
jgi:hypothetical protein